jgi:hypothetical protein
MSHNLVAPPITGDNSDGLASPERKPVPEKDTQATGPPSRRRQCEAERHCEAGNEVQWQRSALCHLSRLGAPARPGRLPDRSPDWLPRMLPRVLTVKHTTSPATPRLGEDARAYYAQALEAAGTLHPACIECGFGKLSDERASRVDCTVVT